MLGIIKPYMDAPVFATIDEVTVRFHISDVFIGLCNLRHDVIRTLSPYHYIGIRAMVKFRF